MTAINALGDRLLVVLNKNNNYSALISLNPPIQNQKYFRAISNNICIINCEFTRFIYTIDSEGNLSQSQNIIIGKENFWYPLSTNLINNSKVTLVSPDSSLFSNPISIYFEFVSQVPPELIKTF